MEWWKAEPIIEEHEGVLVVRDDLLEGGGSKIRFLPYLVQGAREVVYGGPFCGGAALALSVWGKKTGTKITLFYAQRKNWHWKQKTAQANGANIIEVPAGRMTVVQHRARCYANENRALMLPLGFDLPKASAPFIQVMRQVRKRAGDVDEVWCATGSGMLVRCLGIAFPKSQVFGVAVGLQSRHKAQSFSSNVYVTGTPYKFEEVCDWPAPFSTDRNYEAKAWRVMKARRARRRFHSCLFWNVNGDKPNAD